MARLCVSMDDETASCVADALSYYLLASRDNFGQGYGCEDIEDARTLLHERALVVAYAERLGKRLERLSA